MFASLIFLLTVISLPSKTSPIFLFDCFSFFSLPCYVLTYLLLLCICSLVLICLPFDQDRSSAHPYDFYMYVCVCLFVIFFSSSISCVYAYPSLQYVFSIIFCSNHIRNKIDQKRTATKSVFFFGFFLFFCLYSFLFVWFEIKQKNQQNFKRMKTNSFSLFDEWGNERNNSE